MGAIVFAADLITWKSQDLVWVEQWPLPKEKLLADKMLISEQLELGHIEPSNSPWNTPIFVASFTGSESNYCHHGRHGGFTTWASFPSSHSRGI